MRRREFLGLVSAAVAAWPLTARAQQPTGMRRVGVFVYFKEEDLLLKSYIAAFQKQLAALGWSVGNNLKIDYRWTGGNADLIRKYAAELVALNPDAVLIAGGSLVGPMQQVSRTVPIVFVEVADAVGGGFVDSLPKPGGNATGFTNYEYDIAGKWLEFLKQIAPRMTRTAFLRDATNPSGAAQFGVIQGLARSFGVVEVSPIGSRDAAEVERGVREFASKPNGGLVVAPNAFALTNREMVIGLADKFKLPTIYPFQYFVSGGGLIAFGPDTVDQYRRSAGYVDRILKGAKPADLPVQQSTKVTLAINLKTARALGLKVPSTLLARADEVIE